MNEIAQTKGKCV